MLSTFLYGYSEYQISVLNEVYNTGLEMKAIDGHSFEKTLCAMALTESSAGKNIVGDQQIHSKYSGLTEASLGVLQTRVITAREMMLKESYMHENYYYLYVPHRLTQKFTKIKRKINKFTKIVNNPKYYDGINDKKDKQVLKWANRVLDKNKELYKEYYGFSLLDTVLVSKLLGDIHFNTIVAHSYLKYNYDRAVRENRGNPYFGAISKYNGGWHNNLYYERVKKNMKEINRLVKEGIIHKN